MQLLSNLLSFLNTNKWFTKIGSKLYELITRNGHLISEDITFIESIIDSQNDIQFNDQNIINLKSIYCINR
jgi:hypothetical protein